MLHISFRSRVILSTLLFVQLLAGLPMKMTAQDNKGGILKGTVKDSAGNPVEGVNVTLPKIQQGGITNDLGRFRIDGIPEGTYKTKFQRIGYDQKAKKVTIEDESTVSLSIRLKQGKVNLETVTITGNPVPKDILKSTADVDLLSGQEKLQEEEASMGETVNKMAGINTVNTGPHSGKPVIRGLSGNRIRMLHNGIPMDYQQYGVRHMPNMDPFLAERLEVVQGPSSVLYGSDALGGVVNFFSSEVPNARDQNGFLKGKVMGSFRTNNNQWNSGIGLEGAQDGWGFSGAFVRRSAGNMNTPNVATIDDPSGDRGDPKFSGEIDHTDFDQLNGTVSTGYSGDFGSVSVNYTSWNNEHNFLLPNGKGLGQRLRNDILQGEGRFNLGNDNTLITKLTYVANSRQSNSGGKTRAELPSPDKRAHLDILRELYSGRAVLQHQSLGPIEGQLGVEIRQTNQETRGTNEPLVPSADLFNIGAFAYEELSLGNWSITAGARFDQIEQEAFSNEQLNLPDSGQSPAILTNTYQVFSGSLGANYRFTENIAVKANVGRGFRAPNVFDLYVNGVHGGIAAYQVGNPELEPEVNLNTDLSVKWRSKTLKAKATFYRNQIDNYIFLINTGEQSEAGPPILQNVQGNAELLGGYAEVEAQITTWLKAVGAFETVEGNITDGGPDNVEELPLIPATNAQGELVVSQRSLGPLKNPWLSFGLRHNWEKQAAGRYEPFWQFDEAFPFGRASTDAYTLLDAGIGFQIPWQKDHITFSIQGQNITNVPYRDFLDTYKGYALSPGRNVTFKLNVPFRIIH